MHINKHTQIQIAIDTDADVVRLVTLRVKEDTQTAFKPLSLLDQNSQKKSEYLSLLVSSMANANGGIIVFGIDTKRQKASGFTFSKPATFTLDWLKYFLQSAIQPTIENLEIKEIPINGNIFQSVITIKVPNSSNAPHMAIDRRYYKRVHGKEVLLEEYEIRQIYHLSKRPELDIYAILNTNGIPNIEMGKYVRVNFYPRFLIKNISSIIEHHYKLELYIPSGIYNPNYTNLQQHFARLEEQYTVFSIPNTSPLFQHELATVIDANIVVDRESFHIFEKNEIILKLYYSSGIKTKHFRLLETFLYRHEVLRETDFVDDRPSLGL